MDSKPGFKSSGPRLFPGRGGYMNFAFQKVLKVMTKNKCFD